MIDESQGLPVLILHTALLAAVATAPIAVLMRYGGWPRRPVAKVLFAAMPFLVIGLFCLMGLSEAGVPLIEWALPGAVVLIAGLLCQSDRAFAWVHWTLLAASVLLCLNFIFLTYSHYTTDPANARRASAALQTVAVAAADKALRKAH